MKKITQQNIKKTYTKTKERGVRLKLPTKRVFNRLIALKLIKKQNYVITAQTYGRLSATQIEAARKVLRRLLKKRRNKILVCAFPYIHLTKKPAQARMGRGKGSKSGGRICSVQPGKILFEIEVPRRTSKRFLKILSKKSEPKIKHQYCSDSF